MNCRGKAGKMVLVVSITMSKEIGTRNGCMDVALTGLLKIISNRGSEFVRPAVGEFNQARPRTLPPSLQGGYRIKVNRAEIWRTAEERGTTYPRGWLNMIHQPSCGIMGRGRGEGEANKAFPSLTQCTEDTGAGICRSTGLAHVMKSQGC
ncbi:unnamed protein product [Boreogadus saida]